MAEYLRDSVVGAVLCLISLFVYFYLIPNHVAEGSALGMSPKFFPKLGVVIIGVMGVSLFIVSVISFKSQGGHLVPGLKEMFAKDEDRFKWVGPVFVVVILSFLCFMFEHFGYFWSIPLSLLFLMLLFMQRSPLVLVSVTLLVPGILFALFHYGLNMPLI